MRAFIHDCVLDTRQSIEDDGSSATFHIVDCSLTERESYGDWHRPSCDSIQWCCHDGQPWRDLGGVAERC
jgi:hypothetical protein